MWFKYFKGMLILLWHQVRRLAGLSYYPWRSDPVILGAGGRMEGEELLRTFRIPPANEKGWTTQRIFPIRSGRVLVGDPWFVGHDFDGRTSDMMALVIHDVVPGDYELKLQYCPLRARGKCVIRACLFLEKPDYSSFRIVDEVSVDSAILCVADADRMAFVLHTLGEEFDPLDGYPRLDEETLTADVILDQDDDFICCLFQPGIGDGTYPVLISGDSGKVTAIMVDMAQSLVQGAMVCFRRNGWLKTYKDRRRWMRAKKPA